MQINEVNKDPKIQKAGELLQDIYYKERQIMQWESDSKPSLTDLVNQLNIPFLSRIVAKKDIDLFITVAKQWYKLKRNRVFDQSTTGVSSGDDLLKSPEYYAEEKGKVFKIAVMSPDQYLAACKAGFKDGGFTPEEHLVEEYGLKVLAGSKMPMPYLEWILTEDEIEFHQEGRHRAHVAKEMGVKKMPVMIIAAGYPAWKLKYKLPAFQEKVLNKFK